FESDTFYVSAAGSEKEEEGLSERAPFKSLARAVKAASEHPVIHTVTLLDELDAASEAGGAEEAVFVIEEAGPSPVVITGKSGSALRGDGGRRAVLLVRGGVHLVLKKILVHGGGGPGVFVADGGDVAFDGTVVTNNALGVFVGKDAAVSMTGETVILGNFLDADEASSQDFAAGLSDFADFPAFSGGVRVAGGTFTLLGGSVLDNSSLSLGGAVYVEDGGFFLEKGIIRDNRGAGGAVYVGPKGHFTMMGGSIQNNPLISVSGALGDSGVSGGGVYVDGGRFTMGGGRISGHSAARGGGLYVRGASGVFVSGSSLITENTASDAGGGVYSEESFITLDGGSIVRNYSSGEGGAGLYAAGGGFTLKSGVISNNEDSGSGGGGACVHSSAFVMEGGFVQNNTSRGSGGGLLLVSSSFTFTGGSIADNVSLEADGGGLRLAQGCGPAKMSGGDISRNTAKTAGGGVSLDGGRGFEMTGGAIAANASALGGGVSLRTGFFILAAGGVSENTAQGPGGGFLLAGTGALTLKGGSIFRNAAGTSSSSGGGGVCLAAGESGHRFSMRGGLIWGNRASGPGGGVHIQAGGLFIKEEASPDSGSGLVYGADAEEEAMRNVAGKKGGSAVYLDGEGKEPPRFFEKSLSEARSVSSELKFRKTWVEE
ncbi:MAG: hypothetical protein LBC67_05035, partial [Spirochaetales bacterium]|nr:hypothetical protein [Spirochaetales bacterium]